MKVRNIACRTYPMVICLVLLAVLAGMSQELRAETRKIVDMAGRSIEIPSEIERVAVLTSPTVQIMYVLGEQEKLCAITTSSKRRPLLQKMDPGIASLSDPRRTCAEINVEELLSTEPDICIGSIPDMKVVEKNTDLPTVHMTTISKEGTTFENQKDQVRLFGKIFGKEERVEKYCSYLDTVLARIVSKTSQLPKDKKAKVFMGFGPEHLVTYGGDTYMQERIEGAGCVNVAEGFSSFGGKEGGLGKVSMEHVLEWNPDVIVINDGTPEDILHDPLWQGITAVQQNKVFLIPMGIFIWNRPSAEAAVLLPEWLAMISYPDRFQEMTIEQEIKQFYHEIFQYALSDEEIKDILNPGEQ